MKVIMLLLAVTVLPVVSAVGADFYVIEISPKEVTPDQAALLNITLKNLGSEYAANLRAILDPEDKSPITAIGVMKKPLSRAEAPLMTSQYFGIVTQLSEIVLQYEIHVDENASSGTYYVPLRLVWEDSVRAEKNQTLDLGITVLGTPRLMISGVAISPSKIYADSDFNLSLKIENIGTYKARAIEARLIYPKEFSGERTTFLGTLDRNSESTATYSLKVLKEAQSRTYDFVLQISHLDESSVRKIIEKNFEVYVSERGEIDLEIAGVTTSPTKLHPGKDFTLSMQVENVGKQDAKAVNVQLAAMKEFTGERTSFLGSLKQDDTSTAIFDLTVAKDAEPRSYDIEMQISYLDELGREHSEKKRFSLAVAEAPRTIPYTWIGVGAASLIGLVYLIRRRHTE